MRPISAGQNSPDKGQRCLLKARVITAKLPLYKSGSSVIKRSSVNQKLADLKPKLFKKLTTPSRGSTVSIYTILSYGTIVFCAFVPLFPLIRKTRS